MMAGQPPTGRPLSPGSAEVPTMRSATAGVNRKGAKSAGPAGRSKGPTGGHSTKGFADPYTYLMVPRNPGDELLGVPTEDFDETKFRRSRAASASGLRERRGLPSPPRGSSNVLRSPPSLRKVERTPAPSKEMMVNYLISSTIEEKSLRDTSPTTGRTHNTQRTLATLPEGPLVDSTNHSHPPRPRTAAPVKSTAEPFQTPGRVHSFLEIAQSGMGRPASSLGHRSRRPLSGAPGRAELNRPSSSPMAYLNSLESLGIGHGESLLSGRSGPGWSAVSSAEGGIAEMSDVDELRVTAENALSSGDEFMGNTIQLVQEKIALEKMLKERSEQRDLATEEVNKLRKHIDALQTKFKLETSAASQAKTQAEKEHVEVQKRYEAAISERQKYKELYEELLRNPNLGKKEETMDLMELSKQNMKMLSGFCDGAGELDMLLNDMEESLVERADVLTEFGRKNMVMQRMRIAGALDIKGSSVSTQTYHNQLGELVGEDWFNVNAEVIQDDGFGVKAQDPPEEETHEKKKSPSSKKDKKDKGRGSSKSPPGSPFGAGAAASTVVSVLSLKKKKNGKVKYKPASSGTVTPKQQDEPKAMAVSDKTDVEGGGSDSEGSVELERSLPEIRWSKVKMAVKQKIGFSKPGSEGICGINMEEYLDSLKKPELIRLQRLLADKFGISSGKVRAEKRAPRIPPDADLPRFTSSRPRAHNILLHKEYFPVKALSWAATEILRIYRSKIVQDKANDKKMVPRAELVEHCYDYYKNRFGLEGLADKNYLQLMHTAVSHMEENLRLRMFVLMAGDEIIDLAEASNRGGDYLGRGEEMSITTLNYFLFCFKNLSTVSRPVPGEDVLVCSAADALSILPKLMGDLPSSLEYVGVFVDSAAYIYGENLVDADKLLWLMVERWVEEEKRVNVLLKKVFNGSAAARDVLKYNEFRELIMDLDNRVELKHVTRMWDLSIRNKGMADMNFKAFVRCIRDYGINLTKVDARLGVEREDLLPRIPEEVMDERTIKETEEERRQFARRRSSASMYGAASYATFQEGVTSDGRNDDDGRMEGWESMPPTPGPTSPSGGFPLPSASVQGERQADLG